MPLDFSRKNRHLSFKFLYAVLAKAPLTDSEGLGDRLGGKGLGDRQQLHIGGIPSGGASHFSHP